MEDNEDNRETLHKGGPGGRAYDDARKRGMCQPVATEVDLMNSWMRAAPVATTAIGHTSRSCSADSSSQRLLREAALTLESHARGCHRVFTPAHGLPASVATVRR
ncbi:hypothetical protein SSP24_15940 [Streptomyces spinoverrucosus]|uniref:Uncharacterized protein n=1 Tax=Streptomyces spinoverrucosus TaxID=284043 RepID=A0A4Y3VE11_9ACTN|nr:hypothetical protein SSP24_15940 [Streptomyces spinoverrucosus]GHB49253.1 hypothetical protein GCM10010397_18750 [Streptomyces spinoverrucosus]